jgi:hypothetical protein
MRQINIDVQNYAGLGWMTVDCVATSNITTTVGQTIAGVLVTASTRVLKVGQTAPAENGVYINDARAPEMDTGVILKNTIVNGSNKLYLCQSGTVGANLNWSPFNLENLGNISITNPINGQVLQYNGTNWGNVSSGAGVSSFNNRSGAVLPTEGDYSFTQMSDVVLTSPATGNLIYYDGTNWINGSVQSAVGTSWCAPTAELYFQGSYARTLTSINTWYKIAPSTTFLSNNSSFTSTAWSSPANGSLTWLFPFDSRLFHVAVSITLINSRSNQTMELGIYVNGVVVNGSIVTQRLQSLTDRQIFSFHKTLILNQNDTVEVYTRNTTAGSTTATFLNYNLLLQSCCSSPAST